MLPCYSLDARLVTAISCRRNADTLLFRKRQTRCGSLKVSFKSLAVCNTFVGLLFLNVLVFFNYWAFIASRPSRQFASQAFIFSAHETGIIITFPLLCAMTTMTLGSSEDLFRHSVPRGRALFGQHQKERCHGGVRMHSQHDQEIFFAKCMLVRGENSDLHMGGGMHFCYVCSIRHIT